MPFYAAATSDGSKNRFSAWLPVVTVAVTAGLTAAVSPVAAGLLIAVVLLPLLVVGKPEYVIFFLAVYTPFEEFILKWLPKGMNAPARLTGESLIVLMFLSVIVKNLMAGRFWKRSPLDLPFTLFIGGAVVSSIVNEVPAEVAILGIKNLARYILLFYVVYNLELPDSFWRKLVYALLAVAMFESVLAVVQYVVGGDLFEFFKPADLVVGDSTVRAIDLVSGKALGTLGRYNNLGNFLNITILLAMGLFYAGGEKKKVGYAAFMTVALTGLLVSFSRMSWLGMYLAFVFILLILKKKRVIMYLLAPAAATLVLVAIFGSGLYWFKGETSKASPIERYVAIFSGSYIDKSMKFDRLFALTVTAPAIAENYLFLGLGPGTFASDATGGGTPSRGVFPEYSHKDWLGINRTESLQYTSDQGWTSIFAQFGLVGIIAIFWAFLALYRTASGVWRGASDPFRKGMALAMLGAVLLLAFQNFVSFNLTYRATSLYFWLIAGYVASVSRSEAGNEAV